MSPGRFHELQERLFLGVTAASLPDTVEPGRPPRTASAATMRFSLESATRSTTVTAPRSSRATWQGWPVRLVQGRKAELGAPAIHVGQRTTAVTPSTVTVTSALLPSGFAAENRAS